MNPFVTLPRPLKDCDLSIIVIDESGSEVHREQVYPNVHGPEVAITLNKIG
jgi:hypothetical protein